jgi:hypothetical protein
MHLKYSHAVLVNGFMQLKAVVHQVITQLALEIYVMPPGQLSLEEAMEEMEATEVMEATILTLRILSITTVMIEPLKTTLPKGDKQI